jgi:hypothetical protein
MVDVYPQMKPDSQLQTILTSLYEDIKGVVCASSCTKSKVVKSKFEDQTCARHRRCRRLRRRCSRQPATSPEGGAAAAPVGEGPVSAPSPGGRSGGWRGLAVGGGKQAAGKAQG